MSLPGMCINDRYDTYIASFLLHDFLKHACDLKLEIDGPLDLSLITQELSVVKLVTKHLLHADNHLVKFRLIICRLVERQHIKAIGDRYALIMNTNL